VSLVADRSSPREARYEDLAAFPLGASAMPVHDPEAAAVFTLPGSCALLVTVKGRELVRDGELLNADPGLPSRVETTARLMREWARNRANR